MPIGYPLTDDEKLRICELLEAGKHQREVAKIIGVSQSTVHRVKTEMYGKDVRSMDCVIAGNKKYGTLTAVGSGHYVGTCLVAGGKIKKRHFNCADSKIAKVQWESWKKTCNALEDHAEKENNVSNQNQTQINNTSNTNNAQSQSSATDTLYLLAVEKPLIAGYFKSIEEANRAAAISNQALKFAGVQLRYQVIEVNPYVEPQQ